MRKLVALCGVVLLFSVAAAAQDTSVASEAASPASSTATPPRYGGSSLFHWQVGMNYSYTRFRPGSTASFNLHGFNTSVVAYLKDWIGLEGDVGAGFGSTPSSGGPGNLSPGNLDAKLLTYGGGVRIAHRGDHRFEPWAHGLFGGARFRFTQTGGPSANLATINGYSYTLGTGVDYKLGARIYLRVQGDFLATHFISAWQKNAQIQSGLVILF